MDVIYYMEFAAQWFKWSKKNMDKKKKALLETMSGFY
jgi:hypothetical protein